MSLVGWGLYVAVQAGYCLVHTKVVARSEFDLRGLLVWAFSEWGVCFLMTSLTFGVLRRCETSRDKRALPYLTLGACALAVSLGIRIGIDAITGARAVPHSLVIFFPRHLAALTGVIVIWHLFVRSSASASSALSFPAGEPRVPHDRPLAPLPAPPSFAGDPRVSCADQGSDRSNTLLVSKGHDNCLIRLDRIQYVSAAGNYVEICCNHQLYMMRATMKQVEGLLPPSLFLRIHRSHIVNISEIERIRTRSPGKDALQLRCGKKLSLSKKYKARLDKYRM